MKAFSIRSHGALLFRSYLIIVGGLIVIASVLDYTLDRLQDRQPPLAIEWIEGNLSLIERQLATLPESDWSAAIDELEESLGFPVRVIPMDLVLQPNDPENVTQQVFDEQGQAAFLRNSKALNSVIQIGPIAAAEMHDNWLIRLIPPLFYLSIFLFVGLWLWPLVRDLNVLTESAALFAADYRKPIKTRDKVTSLSDLARSFDEMSLRISDLIQRQKELTGALSHEMRTPLARIKFAIAMLGESDGNSGELASISEDIQEIDELIKKMLDYARLDHPDRDFTLELTPMDTWLSQTIEHSRLEKPGLQIDQEATAGLVQFDPGLMQLAVSNLLVNACRYARSRVLARFSAEAGRCLLSVEDDGQGIPESERETVFKAFMRLDSSRNRETGGHGLGLAIVARIASLHGGSAWAEPSGLGGVRIVMAWPCQEILAPDSV